jgi:hypothetical protein
MTERQREINRKKRVRQSSISLQSDPHPAFSALIHSSHYKRSDSRQRKSEFWVVSRETPQRRVECPEKARFAYASAREPRPGHHLFSRT